MELEQKPIKQNTQHSFHSVGISLLTMLAGVTVFAIGALQISFSQEEGGMYSVLPQIVLCLVGVFLFIFGLLQKLFGMTRRHESDKSVWVSSLYGTITVLGILPTFFLVQVFVPNSFKDAGIGGLALVPVALVAVFYFGFWLLSSIIYSLYHISKLVGQIKKGEAFSRAKLFSYFLFFLVTTVAFILLLFFTID